MEKAIIFGASGQDGFYLSKILFEQNIEVFGVSRNLENNKNYFKGDVSDRGFVQGIISKILPNYVFHLAADSTTNHGALYHNQSSIHMGTINILEAVRVFCPNSKVFISGSAIQFENTGRPITEKTPFKIACQYSLARVQSVLTCRYYRENFNISVYIGYFFHHDSPKRSQGHINQKIVSFVSKLGSDEKNKLVVGDIWVEKEFNHAEDMMRGVWALMGQKLIFEIIIGSGKSHTIKEWIEYCFTKKGYCWEEYVETNSEYTAPFRRLVSDPTLLRSLGWSPRYTLTSLADEMLKGEG